MVKFQEKVDELGDFLKTIPAKWIYSINEMSSELPLKVNIEVYKVLFYENFKPESVLRYVAGKKEFKKEIMDSCSSSDLAMALIKGEINLSALSKEQKKEAEFLIYKKFSEYLSKDFDECGIEHENACGLVFAFANSSEECKKADKFLKEIGLILKHE
ncbi:MAG: hypothetical protein PHT91_02000 [Candidatus Nanoarchaeia archaeon]|nr:hypothetical protein [Candidatus Nanoarchaeia archaeon]